MATDSKPMERRTVTVSKQRSQYDHEVLDIARVVRVVKGGRRFRFRASVLVGNRSGKVGFGVGKSRDVQSAIQKAQAQAEKNLITIDIKGDTIAHEVFARYKGAQLKLRPAQPGTGIIAGNVVRAVAELAGVKDIVSKAYGSSNKINNVKAALRAFQSVMKKK